MKKAIPHAQLKVEEESSFALSVSPSYAEFNSEKVNHPVTFRVTNHSILETYDLEKITASVSTSDLVPYGNCEGLSLSPGRSCEFSLKPKKLQGERSAENLMIGFHPHGRAEAVHQLDIPVFIRH